MTAKARKNADGAVALEITNPTPYDTHVSVLAETAAGQRMPLPDTACLAFPKVPLKSGATRTVLFATAA